MYINCKGQLVDLEQPRIMGILNITPDSFYDGGRKHSLSQRLTHAEQMLKEGADFIDVGAYSSRPGATDITEETELARLMPVVEAILREFPSAILSVDTFRSRIAREAVTAGAAMVNDISAGNLDPGMIPSVAELQVPYIMMHMKGTPQNMKEQTDYQNLLQDILYYFSQKILAARNAGINDLIIDPGFGFSKTIRQNFELLSHLELFGILELPLLCGLSRKSMIYKTLGTGPEEALNGTSVLNTLSLTKGANILRVHDVREAVECVKLLSHLKN